jgi:excisionase family DNA binding protein
MSTQLLTVAEAATALRVGRTLVYELVLRGELGSIKIGRARRIPISAVEDFIRARLGETWEVEAATVRRASA